MTSQAGRVSSLHVPVVTKRKMITCRMPVREVDQSVEPSTGIVKEPSTGIVKEPSARPVRLKVTMPSAPAVTLSKRKRFLGSEGFEGSEGGRVLRQRLDSATADSGKVGMQRLESSVGTSLRQRPSSKVGVVGDTLETSKKDQVPISKKDQVPISKKDPVPISKKDPVPISKKDPVPISKKDPVPIRRGRGGKPWVPAITDLRQHPGPFRPENVVALNLQKTSLANTIFEALEVPFESNPAFLAGLEQLQVGDG